ncbi:MAG: hypothetical protein Q8M98_06640 [Candidatus Cloacimonadaceae bacterium]|nr:hypothetical protein [Candidatus Cloacimonadaceae bacterium]MDP3114438.1 hypothetical protein [Candidatus Cloacimonadaceae bacterium]
MPYMNISFLVSGLKAIKTKQYPKWFKTLKDFNYESGDIEKHYQNHDFDLPDGNARRWDYVIIRLKNNQLQRAIFAEPHPIKTTNVKEVLEKLAWLQYQITNHSDLQHFKEIRKEYYWIYSNSKISPNSKERRMCAQKGLVLTGIPLVV